MTTRITGLLLFAATVVVVAPRLYAIQDCHDDVGRLVPRSSAVVVATITAIGTRNGPPCPGFPTSVSYPEGQRCGLFQTFDLHVEKQLKGSVPSNVTVTVPNPLPLRLLCDDPTDIRKGARVGLCLRREGDIYWVQSSTAGVFDGDERFESEVNKAVAAARK
jgi:hypothetical protein